MPHRTAAKPPPSGPSKAALEVPGAALELLTLPPAENSAADQLRGARCVWCRTGPLHTDTAVDLGEHKTTTGEAWFPRSCQRCAGNRAHRALYAHIPMCEQCADEAGICETGRILYRLIRQGQRP
ncbi:hypothetical protein AB0E75_07935 [Streptomyces griseoviridis]|uniref:Uncharacterized protein n=1 Tax=Streptomyces griseoviridis TaxID=45398 RepID=A0A918GCW8_STRGD|nr:hypothetical protein [Streptomyces niveoruber]GGS29462.1 hypothetical protein GCM10010238_17910 [Streptomyces niveoruber]